MLGAVLGAFLAAWHGRELTGEWLPSMWVARFRADSLWLRIGVAFAGGIFMAFGARLAGACTSGHGISGTMQLAVGSWISVICFFIGGIAVAMLMFGFSHCSHSVPQNHLFNPWPKGQEQTITWPFGHGLNETTRKLPKWKPRNRKRPFNCCRGCSSV